MAICFLLPLAPACGTNGPPLLPTSGPCPGESGFGARLSGAESDVDVCVPDDSVMTVFTFTGWYDVSVRHTGDDGTVYQFNMMFPHHDSSRKLNVTGNLADARADANGAWLNYIEQPPDGPAIESATVSGGTFRLGYSDTEVVAGLLAGIVMDMQFSDSGDAAGTRTLSEGFFSILTDIRHDSLTR
jgi:hypothetical protein